MIQATLIAMSLFAQAQCALRVQMTSEGGDELTLYVAGNNTSYSVLGSHAMIWLEGASVQRGNSFAATFGDNFTISLDQERCATGETWEMPLFDGEATTFRCIPSTGIQGQIPAAFADVPGAIFVQAAPLTHTTVFNDLGELLGLWWGEGDPYAPPLRRGVWVAQAEVVSSTDFVTAIADDVGCARR